MAVRRKRSVVDGRDLRATMRRLYTPLYPNVYVPRDVTVSAPERARAAWLWSKRRGIVSGLSAAAVLGSKWFDAGLPAELIHDNRRPPTGLVVRTERALPDELVSIAGMPVTDPARTAFDLGRHLESRVLAVQRLDALANATGLKHVDVEAVITAGDRRPAGIGRRGASRAADAGPRVRRVPAVRRASRHGLSGSVGRHRVRRITTLDRSAGEAARHRQAVRVDGTRLGDRPRQPRPAAASADDLCGEGRERAARTRASNVNLATLFAKTVVRFTNRPASP